MSNYKRKTRDEYQVQGNCGYGWDVETYEETYKEAKIQAKCYRENVSYPIRIVKKRVKNSGRRIIMKELSKYEVKANDFLTKHDAMVRFDFIGKKMYFDNDYEPRNVYSVTISRDGKKDVTFPFGDSIYNTQKKIAPTCYDVLACLQKYPVDGDVFDFAEEFGYPIGDRKSYLKAFKTYDAVREEYGKVYYIFGDCMEELREIQ